MATTIVRVKDLPVNPAAGVQLKCWSCHAEYSAHRHDYFLAAPNTVMTCCDEPLELLRKRTVWEAA